MGRGEGRGEEAGQRLVVMITGGDSQAGYLTVLVLLSTVLLRREKIFSPSKQIIGIRCLAQRNSGQAEIRWIFVSLRGEMFVPIGLLDWKLE